MECRETCPSEVLPIPVRRVHSLRDKAIDGFRLGTVPEQMKTVISPVAACNRGGIRRLRLSRRAGIRVSREEGGIEVVQRDVLPVNQLVTKRTIRRETSKESEAGQLFRPLWE
jgi:hypothetical protein